MSDPTHTHPVDPERVAHARARRGRRDGRGHFKVRIVAAAFADLPPLARHRAVYAALGELMQTDIHALQIEASAPGSAG